MREIGKNSARGFSKVIKIPHKNKKKINFVKGLKRKCSLRDEKKKVLNSAGQNWPAKRIANWKKENIYNRFLEAEQVTQGQNDESNFQLWSGFDWPMVTHTVVTNCTVSGGPMTWRYLINARVKHIFLCKPVFNPSPLEMKDRRGKIETKRDNGHQIVVWNTSNVKDYLKYSTTSRQCYYQSWHSFFGQEKKAQIWKQLNKSKLLTCLHKTTSWKTVIEIHDQPFRVILSNNDLWIFTK